MNQNEPIKLRSQLDFSKLKTALKNIKSHTSYYVGRTLYIDFEDMPSVGLNLNGRGYTYHPDAVTNVRKNILLTREMTELVNQIYLANEGKDASK